MRGATAVFMECTNVFPRPASGHISLNGVIRLLKRIQPRQAWLLHYSGSSDPMGPMSKTQLTDHTDRAAAAHGLASVRWATPGMTLSFGV